MKTSKLQSRKEHKLRDGYRYSDKDSATDQTKKEGLEWESKSKTDNSE